MEGYFCKCMFPVVDGRVWIHRSSERVLNSQSWIWCGGYTLRGDYSYIHIEWLQSCFRFLTTVTTLPPESVQCSDPPQVPGVSWLMSDPPLGSVVHKVALRYNSAPDSGLQSDPPGTCVLDCSPSTSESENSSKPYIPQTIEFSIVWYFLCNDS